VPGGQKRQRQEARAWHDNYYIGFVVKYPPKEKNIGRGWNLGFLLASHVSSGSMSFPLISNRLGSQLQSSLEESRSSPWTATGIRPFRWSSMAILRRRLTVPVGYHSAGIGHCLWRRPCSTRPCPVHPYSA
jgi:hypothetical protein